MSQASQENGEDKQKKGEDSKDQPDTAEYVENVVTSVETLELTSKGEQNVKKEAKDVAGYSENMNPAQIERSRTFSELMDDRLSDMKLMEWHNQLGDAMQVDRMNFDAKIPNDEIKDMINEVGGYMRKIVHNQEAGTKIVYYFYPKVKALEKALDMAYKLKGRYDRDQMDKSKSEYEKLSTSELIEKRQKLEDFYKKRD